MKYNFAEINKIAIKYAQLPEQDLSEKDKFERNCCINKLSFLVFNYTAKYKRFPNYPDLVQFGMMGLVRALETFKEEKGYFYHWAGKYIKTKVQRKANSHSDIKISLKKSKINKPWKLSLPLIKQFVDPNANPLEHVEISELEKLYSKLSNIVNDLQEPQKSIIKMAYGFDGIKRHPINKISKELSLNQNQCRRIIKNAHKHILHQLKQKG